VTSDSATVQYVISESNISQYVTADSVIYNQKWRHCKAKPLSFHVAAVVTVVFLLDGDIHKLLLLLLLLICTYVNSVGI